MNEISTHPFINKQEISCIIYKKSFCGSYKNLFQNLQQLRPLRLNYLFHNTTMKNFAVENDFPVKVFRENLLKQ
jgi:hypothetical protein